MTASKTVLRRESSASLTSGSLVDEISHEHPDLAAS
jgi:hypothetical protein